MRPNRVVDRPANRQLNPARICRDCEPLNRRNWNRLWQLQPLWHRSNEHTECRWPCHQSPKLCSRRTARQGTLGPSFWPTQRRHFDPGAHRQIRRILRRRTAVRNARFLRTQPVCNCRSTGQSRHPDFACSEAFFRRQSSVKNSTAPE